MTQPSPNLKYDHVYAIVRFDSYMGDYLPDEPNMAITVTKVLWSEEAANAEARRLNQLNGAKGAVYFVALTRLQRRAAPGEP
jgi:hypothetical protein